MVSNQMKQLTAADRLSRFQMPLLALIVLLALGLRLWGIDYGLPYLYHPDEPLKVFIAQRMIKTGDLNPHYFLKPTLFLYLNALAYLPYYWLGNWFGLFQSPADIPYPTEIALAVGHTALPSTFLLARSLSALFGAIAVVPLFLAARRLLKSTAAGLLAALLLAVSPINAFQSHFVQPDPFMLFFVLLAFWGAAGILENGNKRDYIVAGLGCGLAVTSKYNSGVICIAPIVAHLLRVHWRDYASHRNLFLALDLAAVAFLIGTPFALLDPINFIGGLQFEFNHYSTGHLGGSNHDTGFVPYLVDLLTLEGPILVLALLTLFKTVFNRKPQRLFLATFPVAYFTFISLFTVQSERTLIPLVPFIGLLAVAFLQDARDGWSSARPDRKRLWRLASIVLVAVSVLWPLAQTVSRNQQLTIVDSRATAVPWLHENLPPGAQIGIESYSPFIDPEQFSVHDMGTLSRHEPAWYRDNDFEYLVFSEEMFGRFYARRTQYAVEVARYESLFEQFELVQRFQDGGYEVLVYQVSLR